MCVCSQHTNWHGVLHASLPPPPNIGAQQGCDWTRAQPTLEAPDHFWGGHTPEAVEAIDNTGMWCEV